MAAATVQRPSDPHDEGRSQARARRPSTTPLAVSGRVPRCCRRRRRTGRRSSERQRCRPPSGSTASGEPPRYPSGPRSPQLPRRPCTAWPRRRTGSRPLMVVPAGEPSGRIGRIPRRTAASIHEHAHQAVLDRRGTRSGCSRWACWACWACRAGRAFRSLCALRSCRARRAFGSLCALGAAVEDAGPPGRAPTVRDRIRGEHATP